MLARLRAKKSRVSHFARCSTCLPLDAHLDGFAEPHPVGHQDALAGLLKRQQGRIELVGQVVDSPAVADPQIIARRWRLTKQAFEV